LIFKDNSYAKFGNGSDLSIYHNGSNSFLINNTGYLAIQAKSGENSIFCQPDGEVNLYYDSVRTFATNTNGAIVWAADGADANLFFYADNGDDNADKWLVQAESDGYFAVKSYASGSYDLSIKATGQAGVDLYNNGQLKISTTNDGVSITGIATVTQGLNTDGLLSEKFNTTAGKLSDNTNIDLEDGMVHYFSTQETTTSTPNIRYSSSKSLNNMLSTGDAISITVITTAAAGGYSANWTIDGSAVTEEWVGGSAPSAGGSDGLDIYGITILKTGDGAYKFIGNLTNAT